MYVYIYIYACVCVCACVSRYYSKILKRCQIGSSSETSDICDSSKLGRCKPPRASRIRNKSGRSAVWFASSSPTLVESPHDEVGYYLQIWIDLDLDGVYSSTITYVPIPVVPHKAVAEVSE